MERGHANRMDTEGNVYPLIHMGYRNRYYHYTESLGYKVTVGTNGNLTVDEGDAANANNEQDFVTFPTDWSKWKLLYPHMKVSCLAEDICGYCYTFANKHQILSSQQSAMQQQQQQQQETTHADDCDDERELDEMLNNLSLDTLGAACKEIKEAKEMLIWDCARHIEMARAQRLLHQRSEKATVGYARDGVEHTKRRYTLTCDFSQNMQCPCYNSKQPGCTYYYTSLDVYNFGVVDHLHDYSNGTIGNHMYCKVYHEGIGKKGGTNVVSLIVKTLQDMNILREDDPGGELNIIFDNCSEKKYCTKACAVAKGNGLF
jgi:hypothetical protein